MGCNHPAVLDAAPGLDRDVTAALLAGSLFLEPGIGSIFGGEDLEMADGAWQRVGVLPLTYDRRGQPESVHEVP